MNSNSSHTINAKLKANLIRTKLLVHVDDELKKGRNMNFKINSEYISNFKTNEIYVLLEDTVYESSTNRSEVFSISSSNSRPKLTPTGTKENCSNFSPKFANFDENNQKNINFSDKIKSKVKSDNLPYNLNFKSNSNIIKSPSLKKKDLILEINTKSVFKNEVYHSYKKLKSIAQGLKNPKRNLNFNQTQYSGNFNDSLVEKGRFSCMIIPKNYGIISKDSSFLSEKENLTHENIGKIPLKSVEISKNLNNFNTKLFLTPNMDKNQILVNPSNIMKDAKVNGNKTRLSLDYHYKEEKKKRGNKFNIELKKCV